MRHTNTHNKHTHTHSLTLWVWCGCALHTDTLYFLAKACVKPEGKGHWQRGRKQHGRLSASKVLGHESTFKKNRRCNGERHVDQESERLSKRCVVAYRWWLRKAAAGLANEYNTQMGMCTQTHTRTNKTEPWSSEHKPLLWHRASMKNKNKLEVASQTLFWDLAATDQPRLYFLPSPWTHFLAKALEQRKKQQPWEGETDRKNRREGMERERGEGGSSSWTRN